MTNVYFIDDNYDNLDNFFMAALLPMATSLSPINVVLVVIVVVKNKALACRNYK